MKTGKRYSVRRDIHGFAVAIQLEDFDVLHLVQGSDRNERLVDSIVVLLNIADKVSDIKRHMNNKKRENKLRERVSELQKETTRLRTKLHFYETNEEKSDGM